MALNLILGGLGALARGAGAVGGAAGGTAGFQAIVTNQVLELLRKISKGTESMSPALSGTFHILGQAMSLFFKPMADFLGTILRPLALALLSFARMWNQTLGPILQSLAEDIGGRIKGLVIKPIEDFFSGVFDFVGWLGEKLNSFAKDPFSVIDWIKGKLEDWASGIFSFIMWIGEKLAEWSKDPFNFITWLEGKLNTIITGFFNIGDWILEKLGVKPSIPAPSPARGNIIEDISKGISNIITPSRPPKGGESYLGEKAWLDLQYELGLLGPKKKQLGGFVARDEIAILHRGEQVIPAGGISRSGNTVMISNRNDFSGAVFRSELDVEDTIRRANRESLRLSRRRGFL